MRFLIGILGAFVGIIVGCTAGFLLAFKVAGNDLSGTMLCLIAVPMLLLGGAILGVILALRVLSYLQYPDPDKRGRRKKVALVASLVIGIPTLVAGMLFWAMNHSHDPRYDPPSDQQLLANFRRHQAAFNQLVWMIKADKRMTFVGQDLTRPDDPRKVGIAQSHIGDYRRLMSSAEVPCGFETATEDNGIDFYYWGVGCANASENGYKGYAYLTKPPKNLLSNLSKCEGREDGARFYRHIQGHWYLYCIYFSE